MTEVSALRLSAMPATETGLREAFATGMLEERAYCDVKREIGDTPSARLELARDLASFAIDGGTLVVGIDERPADGNSFRPFALTQQAERIEQVALARIDPPLVVRCVAVPCDADPSVGYLLVHVPMSPLAPHQVDGRYWARADKTKRQLSDPEVERYIRRREVWSRGAVELLDGWMAEDPYVTDQHFPHLFVVARPVAANPDLAAKLVAVQHWIANLRGLIDAVESDIEHRSARESTARNLSCSFPTNGTPQKLANGPHQ